MLHPSAAPWSRSWTFAARLIPPVALLLGLYLLRDRVVYHMIPAVLAFQLLIRPSRLSAATPLQPASGAARLRALARAPQVSQPVHVKNAEIGFETWAQPCNALNQIISLAALTTAVSSRHRSGQTDDRRPFPPP